MAESLARAITVFSYAWNKVKTILKLAVYLHQAVSMFFFLNKIFKSVRLGCGKLAQLISGHC